MNILGISAYYHDSAACLVQDGKIVAAAQEERFTRKKHDQAFPTHAARYCLEEGGIGVKSLDYVGFYDKPFIKFQRIIETYVGVAPLGIRTFLKAIPVWIKNKLWIPDAIQRELEYDGPVLFTEHHESHAASAFFPSPFDSAAVLTIDGVGEWATTTIGKGQGNDLEILEEIRFPHSLGLLYSAFTYFTGFKVNSGEYKLMGLAPYGEPRYTQKILDELIDLKADGSFRLNMKFFNYLSGVTMTSRAFDKLFGGPPRKPESSVTQREMDLARSVQEVTEEVMLRQARYTQELTGEKNLCLAGGVALNCVGNGRLLREGPFENIWIQPAAGDAGGALGTAIAIWHRYLGNERSDPKGKSAQGPSYLGPGFTDERIEKYLQENDIPFTKHDRNTLCKEVAKLLADEKVIGWFQGRMEFGPRALGARSILGDPRSQEMQTTMNLKIKFRESFRPFAPSVLREKVSEHFDLDADSPYMLLVAPVAASKRIKMTEEQEKLFGIEKLKVPRSQLPAITHVDYSARVQTVSKEDHPLYHELISAFCDLTDCPVVVNTSFNVRGEPIVCRPEEAFQCFMRTHMDYLVLGSFVLDKKKQKALAGDSDWRQEFELD